MSWAYRAAGGHDDVDASAELTEAYERLQGAMTAARVHQDGYL